VQGPRRTPSAARFLILYSESNSRSPQRSYEIYAHDAVLHHPLGIVRGEDSIRAQFDALPKVRPTRGYSVSGAVSDVVPTSALSSSPAPTYKISAYWRTRLDLLLTYSLSIWTLRTSVTPRLLRLSR